MQSWTEDTIQLEDITLAYLRSGGSGPQIVCAHGITDSARYWNRLAQALVADGYDVIAYDARGHGHSSAPAEGYGTEALAADLQGLIAALDLDRPILLGHSMGAHTCVVAAANNPSLTRALILEDPPWRETPGLVSVEELAIWSEWLLAARSRSAAEIIVTEGSNATAWDADDLEPWVEAKRQTHPQVFHWFDTPLAWREALPGVQVPALLITGDPAQGAIVNSAMAAEATTLCPHLRQVMIAGAGHSIRRDDFAQYVAAVRAFLARFQRGD